MNNKLLDFFYGDVPEYIMDAGKTFIKIKVSDWSGNKVLKITIDDIVRYYKEEARNIVSGCRTLAGHVGDWRPIDEMANMCLEYFKFINIGMLRRKSRKAGLEPRF